jgi:hypothetical protein
VEFKTKVMFGSKVYKNPSIRKLHHLASRFHGFAIPEYFEVTQIYIIRKRSIF